MWTLVAVAPLLRISWWAAAAVEAVVVSLGAVDELLAFAAPAAVVNVQALRLKATVASRAKYCVKRCLMRLISWCRKGPRHP
jgi:hypothetical protein